MDYCEYLWIIFYEKQGLIYLKTESIWCLFVFLIFFSFFFKRNVLGEAGYGHFIQMLFVGLSFAQLPRWSAQRIYLFLTWESWYVFFVL